MLLLDEPFGALDAKVRKELRRWLRRLHDELHVTSIFVTHDQEEAREVADRVVVINQGQPNKSAPRKRFGTTRPAPLSMVFWAMSICSKGRAHDGSVKFATGLELASTEAQGANDAQAWAYIRPHELDVSRPAAGVTRVAGACWRQPDRRHCGRPGGTAELYCPAGTRSGPQSASEKLIEASANYPAHEFHTLGAARRGNLAGHAPPRQSVCRSGGRNLRQAQRLTKACRVPFFRHSLKDFYAMDLRPRAAAWP